VKPPLNPELGNWGFSCYGEFHTDIYTNTWRYPERRGRRRRRIQPHWSM